MLLQTPLHLHKFGKAQLYRLGFQVFHQLSFIFMILIFISHFVNICFLEILNDTKISVADYAGGSP